MLEYSVIWFEVIPTPSLISQRDSLEILVTCLGKSILEFNPQHSLPSCDWNKCNILNKCTEIANLACLKKLVVTPTKHFNLFV